MALYEVNCDTCDFTQQFCDLPRDYEFADEATLPVRSDYAWCNDCAKAVQAEVIQSDDELQSELQRIEDRDEALVERMREVWKHDAQIERQLTVSREQAITRINWRKKRRSPARCLECGATKITYFDGGLGRNFPRSVPHPNCSGTLTMECVGFARPAKWFKYNSEGQ